MAAGTINTVVGSGTLITFPTLLAFGYPPVMANISNAVGLIPGSVSGAVGYRRELEGQRGRILRLGSGTLIGAVLGAVLLLVLPASAFDAIVPALIGLAVLLVAGQPWISRWVARRHEETGGVPHHGAIFVWPLIFLVGAYCGYFGAAQGVMLMAVLGAGLDDDLQRVNALKNVLSALGLIFSCAIFVVVAREHIDWGVVALLAVGSTIGGQIGASVGRKLPPVALRCLIITVGTVAVAALLFG